MEHPAALSALGDLHERAEGSHDGSHAPPVQSPLAPVDGTSGRGLTVSILNVMSAEREELRQLVEELPDEQVSAVLAEARRRVRPQPAGAWPPAWFGSITSDRTDLGRNHEDLLAEGFGRDR